MKFSTTSLLLASLCGCALAAPVSVKATDAVDTTTIKANIQARDAPGDAAQQATGMLDTQRLGDAVAQVTHSVEPVTSALGLRGLLQDGAAGKGVDDAVHELAAGVDDTTTKTAGAVGAVESKVGDASPAAKQVLGAANGATEAAAAAVAPGMAARDVVGDAGGKVQSAAGPLGAELNKVAAPAAGVPDTVKSDTGVDAKKTAAGAVFETVAAVDQTKAAVHDAVPEALEPTVESATGV